MVLYPDVDPFIADRLRGVLRYWSADKASCVVAGEGSSAAILGGPFGAGAIHRVSNFIQTAIANERILPGSSHHLKVTPRRNTYTASGLVMEKIIAGELEVRGRQPGKIRLPKRA